MERLYQSVVLWMLTGGQSPGGRSALADESLVAPWAFVSQPWTHGGSLISLHQERNGETHLPISESASLGFWFQSASFPPTLALQVQFQTCPFIDGVVYRYELILLILRVRSTNYQILDNKDKHTK